MLNQTTAGAAQIFCGMKRAFHGAYDGGAHIQEMLPRGGWMGMDAGHMDALHRLCRINPIYHNRYPLDICGVPCTVYEGDINQYWLDSTKNPGSTQPFYPTWMLSAYMLARRVLESGYSQVIDVGSGDGRIAFCARMLGMDACSVEIDPNLAGLQRRLADAAGAAPRVECADAADFEYGSLGYDNPVLFTGGLPQMGDVLATDIMERLRGSGTKCGVVLAGSHPRGRQRDAPDPRYGWGQVMDRFGLRVRWTMNLPTVWTFDQDRETPYMCAVP